MATRELAQPDYGHGSVRPTAGARAKHRQSGVVERPATRDAMMLRIRISEGTYGQVVMPLPYDIGRLASGSIPNLPRSSVSLWPA